MVVLSAMTGIIILISFKGLAVLPVISTDGLLLGLMCHPCNNILLFTHYARQNLDEYERKNHINLKASHRK